MSSLALFGGAPAVTMPHPHFEWPLLGTEEIDAVIHQMIHGEISIYGRKGIIAKFEDHFAQYHDIPFALMTNTGTAALHAAFFAVGVGPGDEVIAPSYTFHATVTPILHCFGLPVLCDSETDTGNINVASIEEKISDRTKAIVITHMWGHPCEMDQICDLARSRGLHLIEDCSHAHGATYKNKKVGTFGDIAVFSLQANKIITGGEGGILLTHDRVMYERATLFSDYRKRPAQEVETEYYRQFVATGYGLKLRAHPLAAAIADVQLRRLDERIEARHENLRYLSQRLYTIPGIDPPVTRSYVHRGAWYGYKPLYRPEALGGVSKQRYIEALQAEGVEVHEPGSEPLHLLPLFRNPKNWPYQGPHLNSIDLQRYSYKPGDLPCCEAYYAKALSLPTFTLPSKDVIDQYASAFEKVYIHHEELL